MMTFGFGVSVILLLRLFDYMHSYYTVIDHVQYLNLFGTATARTQIVNCNAHPASTQNTALVSIAS